MQFDLQLDQSDQRRLGAIRDSVAMLSETLLFASRDEGRAGASDP
jgi:hypothetical protein